MAGTSTENLPRRIGRYEVAGVIAERASPVASRIFVATDSLRTSAAKAVVIKRLATALTTDSSIATSFVAAARDIAKGLRHENVVEIRAVDREGSDVFLVMDYIPGETLARVMQRLKDRVEELPLLLAAYIVSQACRGLDAAHAARFVHGHVTPADIFIGYDGSVRVLDVGIAEAKNNLATRAGVPIGPVDEEYASPEQRQKTPIDKRSDVFSLGKILLEIALARLGDIAKGALDPDPAKRYPDAATLGRALDEVIGDATPREDLVRLLARIFEQRIRDKKELVHRLSGKSTSKDLRGLDYTDEEETFRPSGEAVAMAAAPVKDIEPEHPADQDDKIPSGISKPSGGKVTSGAKVVIHRPQSDPSLRTSHPQPPRLPTSVPPQVDPVEPLASDESVQPLPATRFVDDTEARARRQEETAVVVRGSAEDLPPAKKSGKGLRFALIALVLVGLGIGAVVGVLRRKGTAPSSTTTTATVGEIAASASVPPPPPPPPPALASEVPSAVVAKANEETSIMIDTVPAKATISIAGTKMGVSPVEIKVPKSDEQLVLEIKRPGYVTLKEKVTPNLNQRLKLTLVAAKGAQPAASNPYRKFE